MVCWAHSESGRSTSGMRLLVLAAAAGAVHAPSTSVDPVPYRSGPLSFPAHDPATAYAHHADIKAIRRQHANGQLKHRPRTCSECGHVYKFGAFKSLHQKGGTCLVSLADRATLDQRYQGVCKCDNCSVLLQHVADLWPTRRIRKVQHAVGSSPSSSSAVAATAATAAAAPLPAPLPARTRRPTRAQTNHQHQQ